jgi:hypothetical protein
LKGPLRVALLAEKVPGLAERDIDARAVSGTLGASRVEFDCG